MICPHCQGEVDDEDWAELAHMTNVHPDIIVKRMAAAGRLDPSRPLHRFDYDGPMTLTFPGDSTRVLIHYPTDETHHAQRRAGEALAALVRIGFELVEDDS